MTAAWMGTRFRPCHPPCNPYQARQWWRWYVPSMHCAHDVWQGCLTFVERFVCCPLASPPPSPPLVAVQAHLWSPRRLWCVHAPAHACAGAHVLHICPCTCTGTCLRLCPCIHVSVYIVVCAAERWGVLMCTRFGALSLLVWPGEKVVLVATGSLTNVALLLAVYPEVKDLLKEIVIMGGAIGSGNTSPSAEFNIQVGVALVGVVGNVRFAGGCAVVETIIVLRMCRCVVVPLGVRWGAGGPGGCTDGVRVWGARGNGAAGGVWVLLGFVAAHLLVCPPPSHTHSNVGRSPRACLCLRKREQLIDGLVCPGDSYGAGHQGCVCPHRGTGQSVLQAD